MANRVSAAEVKLLFNNIDLSDNEINSFISDSNILVNVYLEDKIVEESILFMIEKYIAAHFIAMTVERQSVSEKIGDITISYNSINGFGFNSTTYGQMACKLDYTGTLENIDNRKTKFRFIAT